MHNRSIDSLALPGFIHRRSRTHKAEMQAFRRELARLDHIQDHVLDVVTDRLLDALDIRDPEPAQAVEHDQSPVSLEIRVSPGCLEQTIGSMRLPTANV